MLDFQPPASDEAPPCRQFTEQLQVTAEGVESIGLRPDMRPTAGGRAYRSVATGRRRSGGVSVLRVAATRTPRFRGPGGQLAHAFAQVREIGRGMLMAGSLSTRPGWRNPYAVARFCPGTVSVSTAGPLIECPPCRQFDLHAHSTASDGDLCASAVDAARACRRGWCDGRRPTTTPRRPWRGSGQCA